MTDETCNKIVKSEATVCGFVAGDLPCNIQSTVLEHWAFSFFTEGARFPLKYSIRRSLRASDTFLLFIGRKRLVILGWRSDYSDKVFLNSKNLEFMLRNTILRKLRQIDLIH